MPDTPFLRTTGLPTGLRVAQVVGLTSTAFLAGKTFTQTFSAVPALLHAPAPLLAKQWKTLFDSDKLLAPLIVAYSSGVFGWLAYREPTLTAHSATLHNTAALLLLATIPYSLLLLEPLTQQLEENARTLSTSTSSREGEEVGVKQEQTVHWLVDRWATINLGRAVISGVAAATAMWAGLEAGSVGGLKIRTGGGGRMGR